MPHDTQPTRLPTPSWPCPSRSRSRSPSWPAPPTKGLLALAVGTRPGVLGSLLDADFERLAGPKGRHNPDRAAVRHGTQPGQVTLGGRRVRVDRPRL
jgi:hypothetical protein